MLKTNKDLSGLLDIVTKGKEDLADNQVEAIHSHRASSTNCPFIPLTSS